MYITRYGRISKPFDYAKHFSDTVHYQEPNDKENGVWIQRYYFNDEDIIEKFSSGCFYRDSYFTENVIEESATTQDFDNRAEK